MFLYRLIIVLTIWFTGNKKIFKKHQFEISIGCISFAKVAEKPAFGNEDFLKRLKAAAMIGEIGFSFSQDEMSTCFKALI